MDQDESNVQYFCLLCGVSCKNGASLKLHCKDHHVEVGVELVCRHCSYVSASEEENTFHQHSHIPSEVLSSVVQNITEYGVKKVPTYHCVDCGAVFADLDYLETYHSIACTEARGQSLLCVGCGLMFNSVNKLDLHIRMLHGDPLKCKLCNLKFESSTHLADHMVTTHTARLKAEGRLMNVGKSNNCQNEKTDFTDFRFNCQLCGFVCNRKEDALDHSRDIHRDCLKNMLIRCKCINCLSMQKEYKLYYNKMMRSLYKFVCVRCKMGFLYETDYNIHDLECPFSYHVESRNQCPVCECVYSSKKSLVKHLKSLKHEKACLQNLDMKAKSRIVPSGSEVASCETQTRVKEEMPHDSSDNHTDLSVGPKAAALCENQGNGRKVSCGITSYDKQKDTRPDTTKPSQVYPYHCKVCSTAYCSKAALKKHLLTPKHKNGGKKTFKMKARCKTRPKTSVVMSNKYQTTMDIPVCPVVKQENVTDKEIDPCSRATSEGKADGSIDVRETCENPVDIESDTLRTSPKQHCFKCEVCLLIYSSRNGLKRHLLTLKHKRRSQAELKIARLSQNMLKKSFETLSKDQSVCHVDISSKANERLMNQVITSPSSAKAKTKRTLKTFYCIPCERYYLLGRKRVHEATVLHKEAEKAYRQMVGTAPRVTQNGPSVGHSVDNLSNKPSTSHEAHLSKGTEMFIDVNIPVDEELGTEEQRVWVNRDRVKGGFTELKQTHWNTRTLMTQKQRNTVKHSGKVRKKHRQCKRMSTGEIIMAWQGIKGRPSRHTLKKKRLVHLGKQWHTALTNLKSEIGISSNSTISKGSVNVASNNPTQQIQKQNLNDSVDIAQYEQMSDHENDRSTEEILTMDPTVKRYCISRETLRSEQRNEKCSKNGGLTLENYQPENKGQESGYAKPSTDESNEIVGYVSSNNIHFTNRTDAAVCYPSNEDKYTMEHVTSPTYSYPSGKDEIVIDLSRPDYSSPGCLDAHRDITWPTFASPYHGNPTALNQDINSAPPNWIGTGPPVFNSNCIEVSKPIHDASNETESDYLYSPMENSGNSSSSQDYASSQTESAWSECLDELYRLARGVTPEDEMWDLVNGMSSLDTSLNTAQGSHVPCLEESRTKTEPVQYSYFNTGQEAHEGNIGDSRVTTQQITNSNFKDDIEPKIEVSLVKEAWTDQQQATRDDSTEHVGQKLGANYGKDEQFKIEDRTINATGQPATLPSIQTFVELTSNKLCLNNEEKIHDHSIAERELNVKSIMLADNKAENSVDGSATTVAKKSSVRERHPETLLQLTANANPRARGIQCKTEALNKVTSAEVMLDLSKINDNQHHDVQDSTQEVKSWTNMHKTEIVSLETTAVPSKEKLSDRNNNDTPNGKETSDLCRKRDHEQSNVMQPDRDNINSDQMNLSLQTKRKKLVREIKSKHELYKVGVEDEYYKQKNDGIQFEMNNSVRKAKQKDEMRVINEQVKMARSRKPIDNGEDNIVKVSISNRQTLRHTISQEKFVRRDSMPENKLKPGDKYCMLQEKQSVSSNKKGLEESIRMPNCKPIVNKYLAARHKTYQSFAGTNTSGPDMKPITRMVPMVVDTQQGEPETPALLQKKMRGGGRRRKTSESSVLELSTDEFSACVVDRWSGGDQGFTCFQCHRRFPQLSKLKSHMKTHLKAKHFICKLDQ